MTHIELMTSNIVYSSVPKHLSTDVPTDITIQVNLRVDLDSVEFKASDIILWNMREKKAVEAEVTYNRRVITIKPKEKLDSQTHYQLEMIGGEDRGIKTITGRYLEESWQLEFDTSSNKIVKAPIITYPTNQTVVNKDFAFKWGTQEGIFYYHLEISESNTFNHILWPSERDMNVYDGSAKINFEFEPKMAYYARIKAVSFAEEESDWSECIQFVIEEPVVEEDESMEEEFHDPIFQLESKGRSISNVSEIDALQKALFGEEEASKHLKVKSISVKHGSTNVPLNRLGQIVIEFDENINPNSIISDTIYLVGERN